MRCFGPHCGAVAERKKDTPPAPPICDASANWGIALMFAVLRLMNILIDGFNQMPGGRGQGGR